MGIVLTYTSKVRQQLKAPASIGIDALIIVSIAGLIAAVASVFGHVAAPREHAVHISLRFGALPLYTMYSLSRGFVAYGISLVFTLVYGTISGHSRLAEKFMLPALDVLQSIPVLSFLPVLVLSMVHLFPASWLGLELACVIMIFTAQAWNMTFSYHGSVRSIPIALREASAMQRLSGWQIFRYLELPASMIGLVWNSMMSMAGGWFIITINEAFTLNGQDYRLPGLGSYMNQALAEWNKPAMAAAVVAMVLMIVLVDQLFWRPIVVWSERFKLEDTASADVPDSWVLQMFRKSRLLKAIARIRQHRRDAKAARDLAAAALAKPATVKANTADWGWAVALLKWVLIVALVIFAALGARRLLLLLFALPIRDVHTAAYWTNGWLAVLWALVLSFLRVSAAVLIGALWTVPVGVLIGLSPRWSNRLQPLVQILASFPSPMLFPLAILALLALKIPFTVGCIALMLLGTQWYVLFNVIAGAMAIPSQLREAGVIYHMGLKQRWMKLYLPAIFPYLVTGLITAAGGAWNATIVSEYSTLPHQNGPATIFSAFGLGSIISVATTDGNYPLLAASVVTMGLFVVLFNRFVWKKVYRLAEDRYSLNA